MEKNEKEQLSEEKNEKSVTPVDPWSDLFFGRQIKSEKKEQKEEKKEEKNQEDKKQERPFSWL